MKIETYSGKFDDEIIALILSIQNEEAKIGLSLQEQPDLLDIHRSYQQPGGEFWIALSDGRVVGTIGLMLKENHCAVLKKFFVKKRISFAENAKTLGEILKQHRVDCKMTQEFVAEMLGVSRQAVSKWENGTSAPSTTNLMALAKLFGVAAEDLLKEAQ